MNIKIGICGTHGAGKTTFANKLEKKHSDSGLRVVVVNEVARKCPYTLGTIQAQEYIWRTQMERETHAMRQDVDVIITDRTVMDNLIYYRVILDDLFGVDAQTSYQERWKTLYEEAKAWMATYDQVIRLPLNLEYLKAEDPIRPKDVKYARRIDRLFDRFVDPFVTHLISCDDHPLCHPTDTFIYSRCV